MLIAYVIIIGALLAYAPLVLVWYWLVPLLCGQPFLRLFLLAEHAGCPHEADMFHNSRTIYTNPFLLFLSWQMSYHTAHHSFPAVPFHKLARFHQLIANYCKTTSQGYRAFHHQLIQDFERE